MTAPPTGPERTKARRPKVVLFDVFDTLLDLEALRPRFVDVGRSPHDLELFFARTLRDGMALTLAGGAPPFLQVARSALIRSTGRRLSEAAVQHVLEGFDELAAAPGRRARAGGAGQGQGAGVRVHQRRGRRGPRGTDRAQLRSYLRGVLSAEEIHSFKPPPMVYQWACRRVGAVPANTALVTVHSWDVHGAVRAGLLGGFATRHEGGMSDVFAPPHVVAQTLDEVVERLVRLPT